MADVHRKMTHLGSRHLLGEEGRRTAFSKFTIQEIYCNTINKKYVFTSRSSRKCIIKITRYLVSGKSKLIFGGDGGREPIPGDCRCRIEHHRIVSCHVKPERGT
jgi:hypothetical protein